MFCFEGKACEFKAWDWNKNIRIEIKDLNSWFLEHYSYWGRRKTLVVFMLIGGVACLVIQSVGGELFIFYYPELEVGDQKINKVQMLDSTFPDDCEIS